MGRAHPTAIYNIRGTDPRFYIGGYYLRVSTVEVLIKDGTTCWDWHLQTVFGGDTRKIS